MSAGMCTPGAWTVLQLGLQLISNPRKLYVKYRLGPCQQVSAHALHLVTVVLL